MFVIDALYSSTKYPIYVQITKNYPTRLTPVKYRDIISEQKYFGINLTESQ